MMFELTGSAHPTGFEDFVLLLSAACRGCFWYKVSRAEVAIVEFGSSSDLVASEDELVER